MKYIQNKLFIYFIKLSLCIYILFLKLFKNDDKLTAGYDLYSQTNI